MTERCFHSKTSGAKLNFNLQSTHFATIFALGLVFLTAGWLTASSQVVAAQAFKGEALSVSVPQDQEDKPPEKPQPRDFVGTWKASFQGKTFTVLTLTLENDKLAGTLSTGEVDLADDGEVSNVNQEVGEARTIFDIKLDGQILSFKDKDGDDVNSLEMKLTGENRAELRFLLPDQLPQGMPVPKPFRLTRSEKLPHISSALVG
jgi:hypothetical protein